jgi:hypothetical protein
MVPIAVRAAPPRQLISSMRHAGRPRVSTSRPVAVAPCVTDFVGSPSSDAIGARRPSTGPAAPANDFRQRDGLRADAKALSFVVRARTPPGPSSRAKCEDRLCPGQAVRSLAVRPRPRPGRSIAVHLGRFLVLPLEIPPLPRIIVDDDCGRIAQTPTPVGPPWLPLGSPLAPFGPGSPQRAASGGISSPGRPIADGLGGTNGAPSATRTGSVTSPVSAVAAEKMRSKA